MKIYLVVAKSAPSHGGQLPVADVRKIAGGKAYLVKSDLEIQMIHDAFSLSEANHGTVVRVRDLVGWDDEETTSAVNEWLMDEDWEDHP